jgi:hypothetical protein
MKTRAGRIVQVVECLPVMKENGGGGEFNYDVFDIF